MKIRSNDYLVTQILILIQNVTCIDFTKRINGLDDKECEKFAHELFKLNKRLECTEWIVWWKSRN